MTIRQAVNRASARWILRISSGEFFLVLALAELQARGAELVEDALDEISDALGFVVVEIFDHALSVHSIPCDAIVSIRVLRLHFPRILRREHSENADCLLQRDAEFVGELLPPRVRDRIPF